MSDLKTEIGALTKSVTKSWKQAKRSADRNDRVSQNRIDRMRYTPPRVSIRDAAFRVMEEAYNNASSNGKYYANARQIMYAARPYILAQCDATKFDSVYFTQTLLKDYLEKYQPGWKVVWDARGHLIEPYTKRKVPLGGLGVREYTSTWHSKVEISTPAIKGRVNTDGPGNRFSNALFIEKEGFTEILADAKIGEKYDMAIMSTKGIPTDAACNLIEDMTRCGVRVFVLHDFDLAGFKILRTLREGTRMTTGTDVVDLGLRMADIEELPSEPVYYRQREDPRIYLEWECFATQEESAFLVEGGGDWGQSWYGHRVEINAMISEKLLAWLEGKLEEHGVTKTIPDDEALSEAYKRATLLQQLEKRIEELGREIDTDAMAIPEGLRDQVMALLKARPEWSWDDIVWELVKQNGNEKEWTG